MKNWKMSGLVVVASAAVLLFAGAEGRSVARTAPEAQARQLVALSDRVATADAYADNGPGCAESALSP
jgi:hypothetical protein